MANDKNRSNLGSAVMGMDTTATGKTDVSTDESFELLLLNLAKGEKAQMASTDRIGKARKLWDEQIFQKRVEQINQESATKAEAESKIKKLRENQEREILDIAIKMEANYYKYASKQQKAQIMAEKADTIKQTKLSIQQKMLEIAVSDAHGNKKNNELKKLRQQQILAGKEAVAIENRKRKLLQAEQKDRKKYSALTQSELEEQHRLISESFADEKEHHIETLAFLDEQIEKLEEQKKAGGAKDGGKIDEEIEKLKGQKEEEKQAAQDTENDRMITELGNNIEEGFHNGMGKALDAFAGKALKAVDDAIDTVGQYKSVIDARLQGTQSSYNDVASTMKRALAISPFVKQTAVLDKLNAAVEQGIAYNVEQRAFLATMTDKIVSTFDAFDANLMRIIRLQQADTTSARMGMEANLLQFFNSTFSDSSYLSEGYDDVSKALIDANAQMTRDMSIAFEYNVQKWMGSLASLGFDTNTISTIAEGINYLGSGNVAALAGNTELQSLLAMSASRAGLSYSDLLVKGIDDSSVNTLLKSMVEYLKEIAEDENAVVKAAYGDVFNFTQSDLRAIKNLTSSDIANISSQTMTYSKAQLETQMQLLKVATRLSPTEMINNVFDNFLYSAGESLASDPVSALMWKTLTTIEEVTGGIKIPFINVYGFGLDLNMSMESLLKTGMFGLSALGQVGNMITSLGSGGGLALGIWGGTEYTKRGGDFQSTVGGVQSSTSGSKSVTSSSSSDSKEAAISSTEEDQESQKKKSKESMSEEITLETLYKELFEKKTAVYVASNPIEERLTQIVAVGLATKSTVDNISKLMYNKDNPMTVVVKNVPPWLATMTLNDIQSKDTVNIGNADDLASKIAKTIVGDVDENTAGDNVATLSDIANILANGTIRVVDHEAAKAITDLNKNFY